MHSYRAYKSDQTGAALVVGLILLVALTLLALASMNTASLDLIMTGNEQYRSRVFAAAETGIEEAVNNAALFNTGGGATSSAGTTGTGEAYSYTVTPINGEFDPGGGTESSYGTFKAIYFTVQSTGTSNRGKAVNTQGVRQLISDTTPTFGSDPGAGTNQLTPGP